MENDQRYAENVDLVIYTLRVAMDKSKETGLGLGPELEEIVATFIKNEKGGRNHFLPKGSKRLTPGQRAKVFEDGLTNMPEKEITKKHKICRATLYTIMKTGGGRFT